MGDITSTITKTFKGETVEEQCKARAAVKSSDDDMLTAACNDQLIKSAAASLHPGVAVDAGSRTIADIQVALAAQRVTAAKGRTSKFTQAEVDKEAGFPNAEGPAAIAAAMRLNRKGN